jgi:GTP-binding protein
LYERILVELEDTSGDEDCGDDSSGLEPDSAYLDEVSESETTSPPVMDGTIQIGIIGRPNAGKSSLLNALISQDRAIVDDSPGTTTDAIAVNWNFYNHKLRFVDTAGIGRGWKRGADDIGLETLRTIHRSQICVLVLDGSHAFRTSTLKFPSRSEVKLGNEVLDAGKCLIIVVNKWDDIPAKQAGKFRKGITACIEHAFHAVKGVPIVFVSAKDKLNLNTMLVNAISTYRKWNLRINSSKLNDWLEAFVARNPPPWKDGQKQYPKFITQTRVRPPTFSLYTNTFATFPENYLKQMKELMKEEFGLRGVPIRINLRSTLMPKPGSRIRDRDVARWKRLGPAQAAAVDRIRRTKKRDKDYNEDEID